MNVEGIQRRVETWIKDQGWKMPKLQLPQIRWVGVKWPPWSNDREHRKQLQEEYERRRKQLQDLCRAMKAESVADLQEILCCMRPATELIRYVNKFKADFGGQVVCLERVQPSLDHVSHRYLLAEAGDTLFASFIGTKQYKDVVADANILQGALFHEDDMEEVEETEVAEVDITKGRQGNIETRKKTLEAKPKQLSNKVKPAAHRGFMARAKGIPALELYRLAQKKKRKLVLCGHSLGGAVAALATLAILRVLAASSSLKDNEKFQVKCITFSQPPVGNAALRDYVNRKGWQHYFKSYCIPEDLVPRFLSPAYFHHYNTQAATSSLDNITSSLATKKEEDRSKAGKVKDNQREKPSESGGEQLVLGLGPVQTPFWRLSRLVPIEGIKRHLTGQKGDEVPTKMSVPDCATLSSTDNIDAPQSLEIEEGSDGVSLKPISKSDKGGSTPDNVDKPIERSSNNAGDSGAWGPVSYLPSYVPFGQLYLLGTSSVESLSDAEYSNLTSVKSVIAELKERLQSHSMKSYRSRFQRIYDLCMSDSPGSASFLGIEQWQQFPHLQQLLGLSVAGTVELGHIVESPSIRTAVSIVPLGWTGTPGEKNTDPLKVDITGSGLHLCSVVQAQVNGNWCSTTVESVPSGPTSSLSGEQQPELHKMRVLVGAPLKRPPKHLIVGEALLPVFPSIDSESITLKAQQILGALSESKFIHPPGLSNFVIYCTTDFTTVSKEVNVRTRRVRLVGLEGAGKTSLFKAILSKGKKSAASDNDSLQAEADIKEGIVGGLCYMDSAGVHLQELTAEATRLKDELWMGIRDLSRKIDLVVLVHNLAHQIPRYNDPSTSQQRPALSLLLDEAKALGVPWVLAITNKFSVSAHQQREAIDAVLKAYQASPSNTEIVNSCPYVIHTAGNSYASLSSVGVREDAGRGIIPQGLVLGPLNFVRRPFQRKATILPVEGVDSFCHLVHRELRSREESSFEEFARDRLLLELSRDRAREAGGKTDMQDKANSISAATIGASLGAGLGIVLAVVMGAASALRKP